MAGEFCDMPDLQFRGRSASVAQTRVSSDSVTVLHPSAAEKRESGEEFCTFFFF